MVWSLNKKLTCSDQEIPYCVHKTAIGPHTEPVETIPPLHTILH